MSHSPLVHSTLRPTASTSEMPFSRPQTPHADLTLGFCGLGAMGYMMARNLAKRLQANSIQFPILVWNRSVDKAEKLVKEVGPSKARIASSPEELAVQCDIIISNLANDEVVKEIFEKFTSAMKDAKDISRKIFVETSTVYPTLAGELDSLISSFPHASLVMAPVFGAPAAADAAQLIIVMAGEYRSKKEVAHILVPAMGRKVIDMGGNLEKAPTFKLIGNSLILGSLEVLAEGFTLAEKSGIKPNLVQSLIKDLLPAPPLVGYGDKMVHDLFDGSKGFAIDGGIKDSTHIRKLAAEMNSPMPALDTAHQHLLTARALHAAKRARGEQVFETLDWSSLVAGTRVAAGLDGFDSSQHSGNVEPEPEP